jgi:hypothetical protein
VRASGTELVTAGFRHKRRLRHCLHIGRAMPEQRQHLQPACQDLTPARRAAAASPALKRVLPTPVLDPQMQTEGKPSGMLPSSSSNVAPLV